MNNQQANPQNNQNQDNLGAHDAGWNDGSPLNQADGQRSRQEGSGGSSQRQGAPSISGGAARDDNPDALDSNRSKQSQQQQQQQQQGQATQEAQRGQNRQSDEQDGAARQSAQSGSRSGDPEFQVRPAGQNSHQSLDDGFHVEAQSDR
jgi:hypothetical protein